MENREHQEMEKQGFDKACSPFLFEIEPPRSLLYRKWPREEAKGERAKRVKVGMKRVGGRRNLPPSPSIALAIFGRERERERRGHGLREPTIEGVERVVKREGEKE